MKMVLVFALKMMIDFSFYTVCLLMMIIMTTVTMTTITPMAMIIISTI